MVLNAFGVAFKIGDKKYLKVEVMQVLIMRPYAALQLKIPGIGFVLKNYNIGCSLSEAKIKTGVWCNTNVYVWHTKEMLGMI